MRNKRVALLVISVLVVVLTAVCIGVAGPALMDRIGSMHVIPPH